MSSFRDLIQDLTCRFDKDIKKAYSSIFDNFKFNHSWYYKITNRGNFSLIDTNPEWMQYWAETGGYKFYDYYRHPKYFDDGFIWHVNPINQEFNKVVSFGSQQYDYKLYLRLMNKTSDGIECFGFTFNACNEVQMSNLMNGLPYLRLFTRKIKESNPYLFSKIENNQIDLANLIGSSFYQKPNLTMPGFSRNSLLQEFAKDVEGFSDGEIEVIKLLVQGYSPKQMGEILFRSKRTIEHRIERIKCKLGCFSKVDLIQKVRELEQMGCF